jgi:hypothetical protein
MSLFRSRITESADPSEDQMCATEFEFAGLRLEARCVSESSNKMNRGLPVVQDRTVERRKPLVLGSSVPNQRRIIVRTLSPAEHPSLRAGACNFPVTTSLE